MIKSDVIAKILDTALKVSTEKDRVIEIFNTSGITTDGHTIQRIVEPIDVTLKTLMANLTVMPVVKISAKQVLRKAELLFGN